MHIHYLPFGICTKLNANCLIQDLNLDYIYIYIYIMTMSRFCKTPWYWIKRKRESILTSARQRSIIIFVAIILVFTCTLFRTFYIGIWIRWTFPTQFIWRMPLVSANRTFCRKKKKKTKKHLNLRIFRFNLLTTKIH